MNKKEWVGVECEVCQKTFKKPIQVMLKTENPDLAIAECEYCSDKCKKIAEETENNKQSVCGGCGEMITDYDGSNGYHMDYKQRKQFPICDKCTKEIAKEILKGLEK